ncbi:MAG: T9SS type A sorting domain-containing protein, partial [Bacteroidia bacterium]
SRGQYYSQYFDSSIPAVNDLIIKIDSQNVSNIWQIGKPNKIIFNNASTLPNAIVTDTVNNYPVNNSSIFSFTTAGWGNSGILGIQWKQKLDMTYKHDGGFVEFKMLKDSVWNNAFNNPYVYNFFGFNTANFDTLLTGEYAFTGKDTAWQDVWLCFNLSWMSSFNDTMEIRYHFKSDSLVDSNREGWLIDNILGHATYVHPVKENKLNKYINVFPNPTNDLIHIETKVIDEFHIIELMQLYTTTGVLIKEWRNVPTRYWFDTNKFNEGNYILKIRTNFQTESIPITIKR